MALNIKKLIKRGLGWLWKQHKDEIADAVIKEADKVKKPK